MRHGWLSDTTLRRTRRPTARGAQVLAREGVLADYCADLLAAFTALGHSKDAKHMSVLEKRLASRLAEETLRAKSFRAQQQAESWAEQRARKAQRVQEALAEAPWEAVPRSRPGTAHSHGALVEDETDGAAVLHFRIFAASLTLSCFRSAASRPAFGTRAVRRCPLVRRAPDVLSPPPPQVGMHGAAEMLVVAPESPPHRAGGADGGARGARSDHFGVRVYASPGGGAAGARAPGGSVSSDRAGREPGGAARTPARSGAGGSHGELGGAPSAGRRPREGRRGRGDELGRSRGSWASPAAAAGGAAGGVPRDGAAPRRSEGPAAARRGSPIGMRVETAGSQRLGTGVLRRDGRGASRPGTHRSRVRFAGEEDEWSDEADSAVLPRLR